MKFCGFHMFYGVKLHLPHEEVLKNYILIYCTMQLSLNKTHKTPYEMTQALAKYFT